MRFTLNAEAFQPGYRLRPIGKKPLLIVFTALLAAVFVGGLLAGEECGALLDRVRQAIGHDSMRSWERGLMIEGRGEAMGMPCRSRIIALPDGRFRSDVDAELCFTTGFDGERGWMVDLSGMPGHLELVDLETRKILAWVMGGHWLDPDCPLAIESSGKIDSCKGPSIVLRLPGGAIEAELLLNPISLLPSVLAWRSHGEDNEARFVDYRKVKGPAGAFLFPHRIGIIEGGVQTDIEVVRVIEAPATAFDDCRPITRRPPDTRFFMGKDASVDFKRLPDNHLLVHPMLNGKDMGHFLLDTGCGMSVIDTGTADALDLPRIGKLKAAGVGGTVDVCIRKGKTLSLGPMEIRDPVFCGIDLGFLSRSYGIQIAGLLGHDFLSRSLIELDIDCGMLRLFEPGAWDDRREKWCEILFYGNSPCIEASLPGGRRGIFILDSGSGGTVAFSRDFIDEETLFGDGPIRRSTTGGVGGAVPEIQGCISWFAFGGHRFDDLPASMIDADDGILAGTGLAGLIGNSLFSRFTTLWDVPGKRIAFIGYEAD